MPLHPSSLVVLRLMGVAVGTFLFVDAFRKFRARTIGRVETLLRWGIAAALATVSVYPGSANALIVLLAMDQQAFGRILGLLVLSNLLLWVFLFRERDKQLTLGRSFDGFTRGLLLSASFATELLPRLGGARILVAIPAFNEAQNLPSVLARVPQSIHGQPAAVLVIDDGSNDGTADAARAAGHAAVSLPVRRGQGAALRLAYDVARRLDAEVVVTIDADGQHDPEQIEGVVAPILAGEKDFVIGSRVLGARQVAGTGEAGGGNNLSWSVTHSFARFAGIYLHTAFINLLTGAGTTDCASGFKAIRVASLSRIDLHEDQFQAAESLISAAQAGLRIGEVPIRVQPRLSGQSKKGRDLQYGVNFTRTVLKSWWR